MIQIIELMVRFAYNSIKDMKMTETETEIIITEYARIEPKTNGKVR